MAVIYSDIELYNGTLKRDGRILTYIYKNFYPLIENFVVSNRGDDAEAKDVFQESVIIMYRKLQDKEIDTSGNFKSYLFSTAKFIWLKKLRTGSIRKRYEEEAKSSIDEANEVSESYIINQKYLLFQKHFQKLSEVCKKILQLHLQKLSYLEIAAKLGYKDREYIKTKKYRCKEILINNIKKDPEYKDIYLDDFMEI